MFIYLAGDGVDAEDGPLRVDRVDGIEDPAATLCRPVRIRCLATKISKLIKDFISTPLSTSFKGHWLPSYRLVTLQKQRLISEANGPMTDFFGSHFDLQASLIAF